MLQRRKKPPVPFLSIAGTISYYLDTGQPATESFGMNKFIGTIPEDFAILSNEGGLSRGSPSKADHYALILGIRGTCQKTVGLHRFTVTPQSVHLVSPNLINSFDEVSPDLLLYMILFRKEFVLGLPVPEALVDELLYRPPEYPPFYELDAQTFLTMKAGFERIDREVKLQKAFYLDLVRLRLLELLYEMNRACEVCLLDSAKRMSRRYGLVLGFKQLVEAHFHAHKTVQAYADLLHITPKYLSELVREETGQTALEVIHRRVLLEAQYLLRYSGYSIKEIAAELGFDTTSHFARFFRQSTGTTPISYRRQA
jgi:AraC-like DNA-binding protein